MSLTPIILITFSFVCLCTAGIYTLPPGVLIPEAGGCSLSAAQTAKAAAFPVGSCVASTIAARKRSVYNAFEEALKKVRNPTGVASFIPGAGVASFIPGAVNGVFGHGALCQTSNPVVYSWTGVSSNDSKNPFLDTPCDGDLVLASIALKSAYNLTGVIQSVNVLNVITLPVQGAVVSSGNSKYTTGVDGKYRIQVYNGTNTVTVSAPSFVTDTFTVNVINADTTLDVTLVLLIEL